MHRLRANRQAANLSIADVSPAQLVPELRELGTDPAPRHFQEAERLAALESLRIMDTPNEAQFDDLVLIAAHICQTPGAMITLIDDRREWFKASIGAAYREAPIADSICAYALHQPPILVVEDLSVDPRFKNHPYVTGTSHLRFYAGAVLMTSDGVPLGTICVVDSKPRKLSEEQRFLLLSLARQVMAIMELRRSNFEADKIHMNSRQLSSIIGHDLKQPLQLMVMAMDRIRGKLSDERDSRRIDLAIDAGMSIGQKLDEVAKIARAQSCIGDPSMQVLSTAAVLESVREVWLDRARCKGLDLRIVPSSTQVISDPKFLGTILGNLVSNAVRYTAKGRIIVGCRRFGGSIMIDVIDTGPGMEATLPGELAGLVPTIHSSRAGLGMGLAVARKAANALGHELSITSSSKGTHARIIVPAVIDGQLRRG